MTRDEVAATIGEWRASKGLAPADDEIAAWADESRASQGLPPELRDDQIELARAILASAGLVVVDGAA